MRGIKIVGWVVGAVLALVIVLLLGVWLFVNPNDYKARIAKEVQTSTGRELKLTGDIHLSVFPWIALDLGPASLGNPPGFGEEPFVAVKHVALRVKVMPLLRGELQVGRIQIDGLDLRLKKNSAGKGNWEDFGDKSKSTAPDASKSDSSGFKELAGVLIKDSRVSYEQMTLSEVNLDIGRVALQSPIPVKASFKLDRGADSAALTLSLAMDATLNPDAKRYGLAAVTLSGDLISKGDSRPVAWRFSAPSLDVDLAAQTLKAPSFTAQFAAAQLSGSLAGDKIVDAPAMQGTIKLEPLVVREFLKRMNIDPPVTRDEHALSKVAASAGFRYGGNAASISNLDVQLDESKITGEAALTNLDTKAMTFDLKLDRIDLDRYMVPENSAPKPDEKPFELPVATIKPLDANGTVQIGAAKVAGVSLTDVRMTVVSKDGIVHLNPAKASLYGGQYAGDITYDAHGAVPALKLDQQMSGIDVMQLLKSTVKSERLSGRANVTMKLDGQGRTSDTLVKSMNGRVTANIADGAVEGIDLWGEINRAQALIKQRSLPAGNTGNRTKFDAFKMSADIANGVATTKDLDIASQNLHITGAGSSDLIKRTMDYRVVAKILKAPPDEKNSDLSSLALADIPVTVTGSMSAPKVRPDLEGIARAKMQQKVDEKKDELKKKLGDKLQDLFRNK